MGDALDLIVITGMSGAGKTVAMQSFEDMGYFCIDNMPPSLMPKFWELVKESGKLTKIALVIDLRSHVFFDELLDVVNNLDNTSFVTTRILYLESSDKKLVSRYKETRRSHPLAPDGRLIEGIREERRLLQDIRTRAQKIIDTTELKPKELREQIMQTFGDQSDHQFTVQVYSFGFKYGLPIDADIVMDVRFLPNPFYIETLRPLNGMDQPVYDYVMKQPETEQFYRKLMDLLYVCLPGYKKEGKQSLVIAIGCTGGQHRSIAIAERAGRDIAALGYPVKMYHRDHERRKREAKIND
ncbi:RNase adapter RapZ [Atopobacter phocae]|uniref:RNase adapter RapZ n=1 Tax=Atopobacter phocae TaxID=136492 RepID=UPI000471E632|nr:RNase adapter RapZ [Atopobacter phocae]